MIVENVSSFEYNTVIPKLGHLPEDDLRVFLGGSRSRAIARETSRFT